MAKLSLEIIDGPNNGQKFPVELGYILGDGTGEKKTDIILPGKNVLSIHAKVLSDDNDRLIIVAQHPGRIFMINSKKVSRVPIEPGLIFRMEEMLIRVVESEISTQETKYDTFINLLDSCIEKIAKDESTIRIKGFKKPLKIRFIQGIQFEETYTIGWGPRRFGKNSLEFTLMEPSAPDFAFSISPGPKEEYLFYTKYPNLVFINGQNLKRAILNSGDKIKIGDTIIEVLELD